MGELLFKSMWLCQETTIGQLQSEHWALHMRLISIIKHLKVVQAEHGKAYWGDGIPAVPLQSVIQFHQLSH